MRYQIKVHLSNPSEVHVYNEPVKYTVGETNGALKINATIENKEMPVAQYAPGHWRYFVVSPYTEPKPVP